ncbi:hypothetical protein FHS72_003160 [Loktanella ponticola]|uniref:Uncharacterized protein n=1 Tax=Yoonia ponticola TaxID=1524255 RepID=A0A7W9BN43_9RHOB|nr:hypothetical protein [Yoonia ponticola]
MFAQSAIERNVWQDARSFAPISRTAAAITGEIALSGDEAFATEGSTMSMSFGNGVSVDLTSEGASWRTWDVGGQGKQTAEVFRLSDDPGSLQNGNTLCGSDDPAQSLFAVFYEQSLFGGDPSLTMAVFQSSEPPFDINSSGLCGTYSYEVGAAINETAVPEEPVTSNDEGAGSGAWRVRTETNPIDDTLTVTLSLAAETGTSRSGDPVTFIARCKSNTTEAYVIWGDFLGDDSGDVYSEWKRVTVRIGAGQAREERWGVSTDRNATFAPSWAGNLLKELLDEDRLVLQTIPYGENPNTAIFDVSGLRGVLGELAETCNWTF